MLFSLFLFEYNLINIVSITFTALILTELWNVAMEIHTWNKWIFLSEIVAFAIYLLSMVILQTYFGKEYVLMYLIRFRHDIYFLFGLFVESRSRNSHFLWTTLHYTLCKT